MADSVVSSTLSLLLSMVTRKRLFGLAVVLALIGIRNSIKRLVRGTGDKSSDTMLSQKMQDSSRKNHVGVNKRFFMQMKMLLPICIPGALSREALLLYALAAVLIARTWLDIWFSGFNGIVVRSIVSRNRTAFIASAIYQFGWMMWPMSIVNNSLKWTISELALSIRKRLTTYAHEQYLKDITFYKVSGLDNRIHNADQLLTQDIDKFSDSLSHLYSDIAKPIVDIFLFAYKLGQAIGAESPFYMISYFFASGIVLRLISPPFGKYTAEEQKLEGEFRFTHSRIITHSEEIAFYGGSTHEKEAANQSFGKILKHLRKVFQLRFMNGIFDSVLVKYYATMLAYYLLARPVFDERYSTEFMGKANDSTQLMEDYSRNSGYLVNLSQAVGRLILAGRDLTRFAGYTSRIAEFFDVLRDIQRGRYERTMLVKGDVEAGGRVTTVDPSQLNGQVIIEDGVIEFDNVPVITPNGDVLIKSLSFRVESGMNCLIAGPNGSGKSSLFRILGNLWPLFGGYVKKPSASQMFYVPQKPYLPLGNLRTQIIYPDSQKQALNRGYDDEEIMRLLRVVRLDYLVSRQGGFDAVADWADVLSGGEKQRIAMARLFYHQPQFAILDECTSAVSVDVEGIMYNHARQSGITLFTVSHRQSLFQFHEYLLRFDGHGGYEFMALDHDNEASNPFKFASNVNKSESSQVTVSASPKQPDVNSIVRPLSPLAATLSSGILRQPSPLRGRYLGRVLCVFMLLVTALQKLDSENSSLVTDDDEAEGRRAANAGSDSDDSDASSVV